MTSRERVEATLSHKEPDRVPLDLGASAVTGMHASSVYRLRQALRLDPPETPVKVIEPYQMLGEIGMDLMDSLGVDVIGLGRRKGFFGFPNTGWKDWRLFDGTPVLVPDAFNIDPEPDGSILMFPEGDRSAPASARMPKEGYYFDSIVRQPPIDEEHLDPADNLEEFTRLTERELDELEADCQTAEKTGRAILANIGGTGFGDIALVPAPWLKHPKGIRDIEEWYVSTLSRREYVRAVFQGQCEIALANLALVHKRLGSRVSVIYLSGTDLGAQTGPFISPEAYRDLYQPFHRALNEWVHANTTWKTFIHSCGSVAKLIPHFIEAGFDVLNPVQTSATGMEARGLKKSFGDRISFWGGGVDTQKTLPFGRPSEVRRDVCARLDTFRPGGGFVFNTIHNVQAKVPVENILALYETVKEYRRY